jgi:hypothetical protein
LKCLICSGGLKTRKTPLLSQHIFTRLSCDVTTLKSRTIKFPDVMAASMSCLLFYRTTIKLIVGYVKCLIINIFSTAVLSVRHMSVCLSVCLLVLLFACLSVCLSIDLICQSLYFAICYICLSGCLSVWPSSTCQVYLFVHLFYFYLSVAVCLLVMSVCPSAIFVCIIKVCLSVCVTVCLMSVCHCFVDRNNKNPH